MSTLHYRAFYEIKKYEYGVWREIQEDEKRIWKDSRWKKSGISNSVFVTLYQVIMV